MAPDRRQPEYLRYSSLGIQMMVIVLMFAGLGWWLDGKMNNAKPLLTALLSIFGVVIALIYVVKETSRKKPNS